MAWFKVDDNFHHSAKVLSIPRKVRAEALGIWLIAGTWSADNRTDGFIPVDVLLDWPASSEAIAALYNSGLWLRVENGVQFHDWSDYQPTREQLESKRSTLSEVRSMAGIASGRARRTNTEQTLNKTGTKLNPVPVPVPEPIKLEQFEKFWSVYPRKQGKGKAKESFLRAISSTDPEKIILAATNYAESSVLPTELKFVPLPQTWLNQERWDDDLGHTVKPKKAILASDASMFCRTHGYPLGECEVCDHV